jgi:hypothetical protein
MIPPEKRQAAGAQAAARQTTTETFPHIRVACRYPAIDTTRMES